MESKSISLHSQIMHFINQLIFFEKKCIFKYEGITLYPSEIHLMEVISQGHAVNATFMAEKLGITKGAVSQTIARIEKKKIITKIKDPYHKNELTVSFTKLGKEALEYFNQQLSKKQKNYEDYLESLSKNDKTVIQEFLSKSEQFISNMK